MKLKDLISRLQEIDDKYDRDLDIFVCAEPGLVEIFNVLETQIDIDIENDLITLEEDNSIYVNSVLLEW